MRIVSWNVNSIRIRLDNFVRLKTELDPDIICVQETKVINELFPYQFFYDLGYEYIKFCGEKSYNGVAIISKLPFHSCFKNKFANDKDSRHFAVVINDIEIHNLYVPAGGDIPDINLNPKFDFKLRFLDELTLWLDNNRSIENKMILLGDLNIAPFDNDVWSHKQLLKEVSHTPIEIEKLNKLRESLNWCDTHREFTSLDQKLYSWWSYRNKNWEKSNRGRRLDHIWISNNLKPYLQGAEILKSARNWEKPSDHVPVWIDLDM